MIDWLDLTLGSILSKLSICFSITMRKNVKFSIQDDDYGTGNKYLKLIPFFKGITFTIKIDDISKLKVHNCWQLIGIGFNHSSCKTFSIRFFPLYCPSKFWTELLTTKHIGDLGSEAVFDGKRTRSGDVDIWLLTNSSVSWQSKTSASK